MKHTIQIRIRWTDYLYLKKIIRPERDETMAHWFYRVRQYIERNQLVEILQKNGKIVGTRKLK
jgi:hypothetical protein